MTGVSDEVEAVALAELEKRVKARKNAVKAIVGTAYPDGRKETVRSPLDDAMLGIIYREDPDPEWRVVDDEALTEALDTPDSDAWEPVAELLLPSGEIALMSPDDELYRIVAVHAPHLCRSATRRLKDGIIPDLLAESARTGKPAAPGIARVKPGGTLVVRPDKGAGEAIERMVSAGLLTWDVRPALPAVEAETAS